MDCLTQMGISSTKLQTGDEEAYNDLYILIQTFDTKKQLFTVQEEKRKRGKIKEER